MQRYFNNVANQNGKALAGASIIVKNFSDLTTATVYSTNSAAVANVKTNPLTSASDGSFWFYAADGHYNLVIIPSGGGTSTVYDQLLEDTDNGVPVASTATWALGAGAASTATTALEASTSTWSLGAGTSSYAGTSGAAASAAVAAIASTSTWALGAAVSSTATVALSASTATVGLNQLGGTDGSAVAVGYVGEVLSTSVPSTSTIALSSATPVNIANLVIPPGRFRLSGNVITMTAAGVPNVTQITAGISSTSVALPDASKQASFYYLNGLNSLKIGLNCPEVFISSTVTGTYFLVERCDFSTGTMRGYGELNAQRIG